MFLNRVVRTVGVVAGIFASAVFAWAGEDKEQQIARADVPATVLAAFEKAYPKVDIKRYSREVKDGKIHYEIESMEGKTHRDVSYLEDGSLFVVEEAVAAKSLPEAVRQTVKKEHPKGKIELAEKITEGKTVEYEVVVAEGKTKVEIKLDASGKVLESEEAKEAE